MLLLRLSNLKKPMELHQNPEIIFKDISDSYSKGFVPKLFMELQNRPEQLAHIWPLVKSTLLEGQLHRVTRELIFVVVAEAKQCRYCHVAHRAMAESLGYCTAMFNDFGTNLKVIEPVELRHTLEFAQYLVSNDARDNALHVEKLLNNGYNQDKVNEVVSTTAVAVMLTTMANGMSLNEKIDPEFIKMLNSAP